MNKKRVFSATIVLLFLGLLVGIALYDEADKRPVSDRSNIATDEENVSEDKLSVSGNSGDENADNSNSDNKVEDMVIGMTVNEAADIFASHNLISVEEYEYREDLPDRQITAARVDEATGFVICTVNINMKQLDEEAAKEQEKRWLEAHSYILPDIMGKDVTEAMHSLNESGYFKAYVITAETKGIAHEENIGNVVAVLDEDYNAIYVGSRVMEDEVIYLAICCPEDLE